MHCVNHKFLYPNIKFDSGIETETISRWWGKSFVGNNTLPFVCVRTCLNYTIVLFSIYDSGFERDKTFEGIFLVFSFENRISYNDIHNTYMYIENSKRTEHVSLFERKYVRLTIIFFLLGKVFLYGIRKILPFKWVFNIICLSSVFHIHLEYFGCIHFILYGWKGKITLKFCAKYYETNGIYLHSSGIFFSVNFSSIMDLDRYR